MKINGKVVSYAESKKFGFIRDDDGQSYFFHISSLAKEFKSKSSEVKIGLLVSFEPAAEPKGMAARKIEFVKMHRVKKLSKFKNHHKRKVESGEILDSKEFRSRFYKSPHDAKSQLELMAKQAGANIIYSETISRVTWSKGNYNYTMHQCTASVGIHVNTVDVRDEFESEKSLTELSERMKGFKIKSQEVIDAEEEAIRQQTKTDNTIGIVFFIALLFLFVVLA